MSQPFTQRHIGTDADAQSRMLAVLGHDSVEALVNAAVPATIQVEQFRTPGDSTLPPAATEREAIQELRALAGRHRGYRLHLQHTGESGRLAPAPKASLAPFSAEQEDWDADGAPELLVEAPEANWYFTRKGGALWEWDLKSRAVNLGGVVSRR